MCLVGYEPVVDACAVCGAEEPADPRFHVGEGVLCCAACRAKLGAGTALPLTPQSLAALRHIVCGDAKRLFSFAPDAPDMARLSAICQAYLLAHLDRGFRTLDFYQQLKGT